MDRNSKQGMVWQTAPGPLFWGGVGVVLSILFGVGSVEAQRVRFSESTPVPSMNYSAVSPATPITSFQPPTGFPSTLPNGTVLPSSPAPMVPLGSGSIGGMGTPTFDPYAPTMRPSTAGVLPQGSGWSNFWGNPNRSHQVQRSFPTITLQTSILNQRHLHFFLAITTTKDGATLDGMAAEIRYGEMVGETTQVSIQAEHKVGEMVGIPTTPTATVGSTTIPMGHYSIT